MGSDLILKIAVPAPFDDGLEYLLPERLCELNNSSLIGLRVLVPLGRREVVGIIIEVLDKKNSKFSLKNIIRVIDDIPIFSNKMRDLFFLMHKYYHVNLGFIYKTAWPSPVSKGREFYENNNKINNKINNNKINNNKINNNKINFKLSDEQNIAIQGISNYLDKFSVHLLHGVTGSGKTEVYSQLIAKVLANKKSVLVLVPEINLTPQMLDRFSSRFCVPIISLHSRITHVKRLKLWQQIKLNNINNGALIILGTRSSIFVQMII